EPATPRIVLHDPEKYALARGAWQDLVLNENLPCARARFEGNREGLFQIDTGAVGTVSFHAPAVEALRLLDRGAITATLSGGAGGSASPPEGVVEWFEAGGHRFGKPCVEFSQATAGTFTDAYTTGNIGQDFLRPFELVFDFPHDRIAFVPLKN